MANLTIGSGQRGMSFEERSDEDLNDEGIGRIEGDNESQDVLISSTDEIGAFTNTSVFKRVNTLWISGFMGFLTTGLFVISAVLPMECDNFLSSKTHSLPGNNTSVTTTVSVMCYIKPMSLILYLHTLLWGVFLICDQFIQYEHIKIRRRGYIEFYNDTRFTSQLAFWVVCGWSTLLLTVSTILRDHCTSEKLCAKSIHLNQTEYITICIGLETFTLMIVIAYYIYQVWRFNSSQTPPDVLRDDVMSCALDFNPNIAGLVDEEIFHRQADLIRFFKDRNLVLQRTVLQLNNQTRQVNV